MIKDNRDIVITINAPCSIEKIHQIESAIDDAIGSLGFSRSTTTKSDEKIELVYFQFAFPHGNR